MSKDNLVSRDKRRDIFFAICLAALLGAYKKGTLLLSDFNSFGQMHFMSQFCLYIYRVILLYVIVYLLIFIYIELFYQYIINISLYFELYTPSKCLCFNKIRFLLVPFAVAIQTIAEYVSGKSRQLIL